MNENEFDEKVGAVLKKWRKESGISQDSMADKLGTARQSIIKIESGTTHSKFYTIIKWAHLTGQSPAAAISDLNEATDQSTIGDIVGLLKTLRGEDLSAIKFIFMRNHGSDLRAFIHMCAAYLHCPLKDRQAIALQIINAYEISGSKDDFSPDIDLVKKAQIKGKEAVLKGKEAYKI